MDEVSVGLEEGEPKKTMGASTRIQWYLFIETHAAPINDAIVAAPKVSPNSIPDICSGLGKGRGERKDGGGKG